MAASPPPPPMAPKCSSNDRSPAVSAPTTILRLGPLTVELDDATLDALAHALAPRLADRLAPAGPRWLSAEQAAEYIAAPVSRIYSLAACKPPRIPFERDGSRLLFDREKLDRWVCAGGGKRP